MTVEAAVAALREAYRTGVPCPPLRGSLLPEGDIQAGYAVQRAMLAGWVAEGRRQVGAKIGLTSPAVQRQLGVDQPDFGALLADLAVPDGGEVPLGSGAGPGRLTAGSAGATPAGDRLLQPKVEAEVAFVLGADLPYEQVTSVD
ncbi:MAG: 2-keto-4-pentenoate hydratase, partial [Natronosporangium sp.]